MKTRHTRSILGVCLAVFAAVILLFGTVGAAQAEGEPAWRAEITAQLPAEQVAELGGLDGLQALFSAGTQAAAVTFLLEDLGMNAEGWTNYRLSLQGEKMETLRAALWGLPDGFRLLGGVTELTLTGVPDGELTLVLESNLSTGYHWGIVLPAGWTRTAEDSYERKAPGWVTGAAERQIIHLSAAGASETALTLSYRRSFESDAAATRFITIAALTGSTLDLSNPAVIDYGPEPEPSETVEADVVVEPDTLPVNFDWRTRTVTDEHSTAIPVVPTGIRNQGSCGSCYAFMAAGVMESAMNRKKDQENLSEQFIVSCTTNFNSGCDGGYYKSHRYHYNTLGQMQSSVGAVLESDFPYSSAGTGVTGPCKTVANHPYKLTYWNTLRSYWYQQPTVSELKNAIYTRGPIGVSMCAGSAFDDYKGGYFDTNEKGTCSKLGIPGTNHEVILVGWETVGTTTYFILRNSWGYDWGEGGYMRIKAGISYLGLQATYVTYTSQVDHTPPKVLRINSYAATLDNSVTENEVVRVKISRLYAYFSETVIGADLKASYSLINNSTGASIPIDNATYNVVDYYSRVYLNGGVPLPDGDYTFTINASQVRDHAGHLLDGDKDGVVGGDAARHFRINMVPPAPVLSAPVNGAYLKEPTVTFTWQPVIAAVNGYRIQIAKDSEFTNIVLYEPAAPAMFTRTLAEGSYYWRVRSVNRFNYAGSWSSARILRVDTRPPSIPLLYTPSNNAVVRGTPTYTWKAAAGAYKYTLHVWNGAGYDYVSPWTSLLSHKPTVPQPAAATTGTAYQWAVQAIDRAGNLSLWSLPRTVIVKQAKPGTPALIAPADGANINDSNDILSWEPVFYGSSYRVQVSSSSTFSPLVLSQSVAGTSFDLAPVASNGVYYWRVRAANDEGTPGLYSTARKFILDRTPPPAPVLDRPPSGTVVTTTPTFGWKASLGAAMYQLHIYNDSYTYESDWTTLLSLSKSLTKNGTFNWQVRARDRALNISAWSSPWVIIKSSP